MRSNVNFSRIVRAAGCFGIRRIVACGTTKTIDKIARDASSSVSIDVHRSLPPVLRELKHEGFQLVGLEQTTESESLVGFGFVPRTVLIVGEERQGLSDEVLALVDRVAEIPVWGVPHSHNAATAAAIAMYEYCRQLGQQ
jgi:tRNA G18 (ribose-2'-O)-methylase SpoU